MTKKFLVGKRVNKNTKKKRNLGGSRRPSRVLNASYLLKREFIYLIEKIKNNSQDIVILRLKDHLGIQIPSIAIDAIIKELYHNTNCQALYFQNLDNFKEPQLKSLIELLKTKNIHSLNLGEIEFDDSHWSYFTESLKSTHVSFLYVSEHFLIDKTLKKTMIENIRKNRILKLTWQLQLDNTKVMNKITNMWYNPKSMGIIKKNLEKIRDMKNEVQIIEHPTQLTLQQLNVINTRAINRRKRKASNFIDLTL